jgi:hypothetical protein
MSFKIKTILFCFTILCLTLFCFGCNGTTSVVKDVSKQFETVAISDGFVLLKYPNGQLYVIDLHTQEANQVRGLSQAGK